MTIDGKTINGRADFMVEVSHGKWEPIEFKRTESSRWTLAQKEYLPAMNKGGGWEIVGGDLKGYKGAGGGKVFNFKTLADAKEQFQKFFTSTIIRRKQSGVESAITITRNKEGKVVSSTEKAIARYIQRKNQRGFAIGGALFGAVVLAGATYIVMRSNSGREAVAGAAEIGLPIAYEEGMSALAFKLTKNSGVAFLITGILSMGSCNKDRQAEWELDESSKAFMRKFLPDYVTKDANGNEVFSQEELKRTREFLKSPPEEIDEVEPDACRDLPTIAPVPGALPNRPPPPQIRH